MRKLKYLTISSILVMALSLTGPSSNASARPLAVHAPNLGAANSFAILAGDGAAITDADVLDTSSITGDVGMAAGASITGLTCAEVNGTIFDSDAGYTGGGTLDISCRITDPGWGPQQLANSNAFADLTATDNSGCTLIPAELGTQTLVAGVYCPTSGDFQLTAGNLDLTPGGAGVWIFKTPAGLTTAAGGTMTGGDPCSVWWRVPSSAVLGVGSTLTGNILALTSITLNNATLNGRAFAQTGAVTMNGATVIRGALCTAAATPTATTAATATATTAATATAIPAATATAIPAATAAATPVAEEEEDTVRALPNTGGAPIQNEEFPWKSLVIVGGFSAIALVLGVRAYRRNYLPKE